MGRHPTGDVARAMWANRPNLAELLLMAILAVTASLVTGLPVAIPLGLWGAVVLVMTARMAIKGLDGLTPEGDDDHEN